MTFSSFTIVHLVVAMLIGAALGWLLAANVHRDRLTQSLRELRERERAEADRAVARLRRELGEANTRTQEQSDVFQLFPDLVRQMFAATGRRSVGPLTMRLVEGLLAPEQSALFVARTGSRKLALAASTGLPASLPPGTELAFGQGRIGYAAEARLAMDTGDFRGGRGERSGGLTPSNTAIEDSGVKDLRADVVAPLEDQGVFYGVLSVAGVRRRKGQEKRLLSMVAEVAAVALSNVGRQRLLEEAWATDGLTGLYNRKYFQKRIDDTVPVIEREGGLLSLVLLDVDYLRRYNELNGSTAGDELLRLLAQILKGAIRDDDVAIRWGGEEFVILFPGATKEQAMKLAESIRSTVADYAFPHRGQQPGGAVTLSAGVATCPTDCKGPRDLFQRADEALAEAKAQGRNRVVAGRRSYLG